MFDGNVSTIANLKSPKELRLQLAERARELRLTRNMRQSDLAECSGVTLASIRRFEKEGEISLKNLMLIAIALNRAQDVEQVFRLNEDIDLLSLNPGSVNEPENENARSAKPGRKTSLCRFAVGRSDRSVVSVCSGICGGRFGSFSVIVPATGIGFSRHSWIRERQSS